MTKFKIKHSTFVQTFTEMVNEFSDEFAGGFFAEILQQKEAFINFIFKDTNDLWKFFNFTFQCLNNLSVERESFRVNLSNYQDLCGIGVTIWLKIFSKGPE